MTTTRVKNPSTQLTPEQRRQRIELLERQILEIQNNISRISIPMAERSDEIRQLLSKHEHVVIVGETGSGKSTILPLILLEMLKQEEIEHGYAGRIAVTQPRVIAATSVARRVAQINGTQIGNEIGYMTGSDTRFDQEKTDVCFLTDKIIINKFKSDPYLKDYSIIMIDEAHERSLNIDFLMGILKLANQKRKEIGMRPIRIVITSATIEKERFARYISDGKSEENHAQVSGRTFEVQRLFSDTEIHESNYTRAIVSKTQEILKSGDGGDILVFLPGKGEITEVESLLRSGLTQGELSSISIHLLHSEISPEAQQAVFSKSGKRKVILATNIAETSITLEGVKHVIDPGFIKQSSFENGIKVLKTIKHSRMGLIQRMGRAGRVQAGKAHLLYTEAEFSRRQEFTTPEIQRSDLSEVVLTLLSLGVKNVNDFPFIDKPSAQEIERTIIALQELGAIDENRDLTPAGEFMTKIPAEPRVSRIIYEATKVSETTPDKDPLKDVITIAAFMQISKRIFREESISIQNRGNLGSDYIMLVNLFNDYLAASDRYKFCEQRGLNFRAMQDVSKQRQDLLEAVRKGGVTIRDSKGLNSEDLNSVLGRILTSGATSSNIYLDYLELSKLGETRGPRTYLSRDSIISKTGEVVLCFNPSQSLIRGRETRFLNQCHRVTISELLKYKPELFDNSGFAVGSDPLTGEVFITRNVVIKQSGTQIPNNKPIEFSELAQLGKEKALEYINSFVLTSFSILSRSYNNSRYIIMTATDALNDRSISSQISEVCFDNKIITSTDLIKLIESQDIVFVRGASYLRKIIKRDSEGRLKAHFTREEILKLRSESLFDRFGNPIVLIVTTDIRGAETVKLSSYEDIQRLQSLANGEESQPSAEVGDTEDEDADSYEDEDTQTPVSDDSNDSETSENSLEALHKRYKEKIQQIIDQILKIDQSEVTQLAIKELQFVLQNNFYDIANSRDFYDVEEAYEFFESEFQELLDRVQRQADTQKQALEEAERQRVALEAQRLAEEQQREAERQRLANEEAQRLAEERLREPGVDNNSIVELARALGATINRGKKR